MSPIRRVGESLLSRLQGGRDIKVVPMDRAAEQARQRLLRPGVAGPDFRAGQLEWSPVLGFSGELELSHNLGRVPKGAFIVSQTLQLQWSTPAAQLAKWTDQKIFFWIDLRHPWELGKALFASGQSTLTIVYEQTRDSAADMGAIGTFRDSAGTDRPSIRVDNNVIAGGVHTGLTWMYADAGTTAFNTTIHFQVMTNLIKSDRFVWQVI